MKIRYSTNWMGPANMQWYRDRGLTELVPTTMKMNSPWDSNIKAGDIIEFEEITEQYSCGRIDVVDGSPYGTELDAPPMRSEDWRNFGDWLWEFKTDTVWTLEQLVQEYEKTNPKIRWDEYERTN